MKIIKFNEINVYKPTDKLLKVKIKGDLIVPLNDIIETDMYHKAIDEWDASTDEAIYYGLEEYITEGNHFGFEYDLIDGDGNIIEDEELFDDKNKYNL